MYANIWFILPFAIFLVLSIVRIWMAVTHFKKDGSLPEKSFEVVSGMTPTVDMLGGLVSAAIAVLGGKAQDFPDAVVPFVSAIAILFGIGALTGFYLKSMVARFWDRVGMCYRFKSPYYPGVKAVFGAAQFAMLISAIAFVIYLVASIGNSPEVDPAPTAVPSEERNTG